MKTKIIAIVVSVVIVAGAATGIGIVVKQANDKNAEELVSAAVSEVMATAESTTEETTTEPTTETTTETTTLRDAKLPARTTTTTTVNNGTGTKTVIDDGKKETPQTTEQNSIETPTGTIILIKDDLRKNKDEIGYYWDLGQLYKDPNTGFQYILNIDDNDKVFYIDDYGVRHYPNF